MMKSIVPNDCLLELVSDNAVEQFRFYPENHVVATLGSNGGSVCSPILQYRVRAVDSIEIFDHSGLRYVWQNIRLDHGLLHVESNGQPKVYRVLAR